MAISKHFFLFFLIIPILSSLGKAKAQEKQPDLYERHWRNFYSFGGKAHLKEDAQRITVPALRVIQVIDKENMLVEFGLNGNRRETWWLTGVSTAGLVDDAGYANFEIAKIGTKKYKTTLGGSRTVHYAIGASVLDQPISRQEFEAAVKKGGPLGKDWVEEAREAEESRKRAAEARRQKEEVAEKRRIAQAIALAEADRINKSPEVIARRKAEAEAAQAKKDEADAARKLILAKSLINSSLELKSKFQTEEGAILLRRAVMRLREITAEFSKTAAGKEAKKLADEYQQN